ncbi:hypothetical protein OJ254_00865 [Streptomyces endophytica]|uniref:Secreted protein n=1 Tax=Streptomyces endophytica TaxID=2991496 RepID=A0ABY6PKY3_9ACTN|nr:hypothetical protein OJ254_00865 [Streptomyces endophytica]
MLRLLRVTGLLLRLLLGRHLLLAQLRHALLRLLTVLGRRLLTGLGHARVGGLELRRQRRQSTLAGNGLTGDALPGHPLPGNGLARDALLLTVRRGAPRSALLRDTLLLRSALRYGLLRLLTLLGGRLLLALHGCALRMCLLRHRRLARLRALSGGIGNVLDRLGGRLLLDRGSGLRGRGGALGRGVGGHGIRLRCRGGGRVHRLG